MNVRFALAFSAALAIACVPAAYAQHHAPAPHGAPAAPRGASGPIHLDQRYSHDHWYPSRGFAVRTLPNGSLGLSHAGGNWFYHGGVWFRPWTGRYIVDVPPFGVVVPFLPPAYVTLWIGGAPYYYANGVYYAEASAGYVTVAPPPGAEAAVPAPPTFFIYPRNGQSTQQTDADRAACNDWAAAQPGTTNDPVAFQRAFGACMDGRGYTVR